MFRCALKERTLLRIAGNDTLEFLQGLFTNDVNELRPGSSTWGCFLNVPGRVQADAYLYCSANEPTSGAVYVDLHSHVADDILDLLRDMKMRKRVTITRVDDSLGVMACGFPSDSVSDSEDLRKQAVNGISHASNGSMEFFADPRSQAMKPSALFKLVVPRTVLDAAESSTSDVSAYEQFLYGLGIGEGPRVFVPEKTLPFEPNTDQLKGVSFHKGCYLGQELTHRTHVMLVTRKRVVPVRIGADGANDATLFDRVRQQVDDAFEKKSHGGGVDVLTCESAQASSGTRAGGLIAASGPYGLALLRLRYMDPQTLQSQLQLADGTPLTATIPPWWSRKVLKKVFGSNEA